MIKLLELRNEKNWSQREIAKKLFISQGTYNNWENGKTEPSIEQLISLSKLFDVSIDYIVGNSLDVEIRIPPKKETIITCNQVINNIEFELEKLKETLNAK